MTAKSWRARNLARCASILALAGASVAAGAQTINGAGATFPNPIYQKWFAAYTAAHPIVKFNYQPVGSGAGYAQYKAGTVDFGASDAPLTNKEIAAVPWPTIHFPTVAGAVVLAYNIPGVGPGLRLDADAVSGIYLGTIKTWNDPHIVKLNPNLRLPSTAIDVVHRSDGSGTTYIFTNYLSAVSSAWKEKVGLGKSVNWPVGLGGSGNSGVAGLIQHSNGSIGYVELAYAVNNKLPFGPIKNRSGNFVLASSATTTAAADSAVGALRKDVRVSIVNGGGTNAYPISGFTYLLVSKTPKDGAKGRALVDFLRWTMGPGQEMAEELFYARLPAAAIALNTQSLGQVRVAGNGK